MYPVRDRVTGMGADIFTAGTVAAVETSTSGIVLPDGLPEGRSRNLEILPFQQPGMRLALARGENPDAPRGPTRVREAR